MYSDHVAAACERCMNVLPNDWLYVVLTDNINMNALSNIFRLRLLL